MAKRARVRAELRVLGAGLNGRVPHEEGARVGVTTRVSSVLVLVPWQSLPTTTISNGWRAPLLVSSFVSTGEHARYAYILFLLVPFADLLYRSFCLDGIRVPPDSHTSRRRALSPRSLAPRYRQQHASACDNSLTFSARYG